MARITKKKKVGKDALESILSRIQARPLKQYNTCCRMYYTKSASRNLPFQQAGLSKSSCLFRVFCPIQLYSISALFAPNGRTIKRTHATIKMAAQNHVAACLKKKNNKFHDLIVNPIIFPRHESWKPDETKRLYAAW